MSWSDPVHPHGALEQILPGIWQVTGTLSSMPLSRNMVIWRGTDDKLVIHSAVCLDEPGMAALEALGEPGVLIVPNGFHRADAPAYKERYPELIVVAPAASRAKVEQVVSVDADADTLLPTLGAEVLVPVGLKPSELVFRVPVEGGHALVVTDALFNHDHVTGFGGLMMRYITRSTGFFGLTGLGRWMMLQDKAAFADWIRELAAADGLRAVLVGHGHAVTERPAERLRQAADRL